MKLKENRKYDILSAGLMVYDILISPVDESIFTKDTHIIDNISFSVGGDALNVAVDCAKLGANVALSGLVGDDAPGDYLKRTAGSYGIDTSLIATAPSLSTSCSVILSEEGGERHFAYYGKSNYLYDADIITDSVLDSAGVLYIGSALGLQALSYEKLACLLRRAKEHGVIVAMDATSSPDNIWLPKIKDALRYCDIFIPSFFEAEKLTASSDPDEMLSVLNSFGPETVGIKLGKDGVIFSDFALPAFRCDNVFDTTGAGDGFMAGFLTGLISGGDTRDCAMLGSAVSNCVIRKGGATAGLESLEQCKEVLRLHENGNLF